MKELSRDELLNLLRMWLLGCKHDTEIVYENCRKCPSRKECKQAFKQMIKLIMEKPKVTRKFIETWACNINDVWAGKIKEKDFIIKLLKEADVEIKK